MDVLVTKYIGIIGTAILARERREELLKKLPEWLVDEAACFDEDYNTNPVTEVGLSMEHGAIYAKEYTEFGIFEALFQMSKELKTGLRIDIKSIPVKQETVEVCEIIGVNPYALFSGNSAVVVTKDGQEMKEFLESMNIPAQIVAQTADNNDKIVVNDEECGFLQHIRKDELKNILGRKEYYERTDFVNR